MPRKVHVIDGPNLNLLGLREPHIYGLGSLEEIRGCLLDRAKSFDVNLSFFQSNHEGAMIDEIQSLAAKKIDWLIINPGGLTHTSISLRDAILAVNVPAIEVHVSNPYTREMFRQKSYIADVVKGRIMGLGGFGYVVALEYCAYNLGLKETFV